MIGFCGHCRDWTPFDGPEDGYGRYSHCWLCRVNEQDLHEDNWW